MATENNTPTNDAAGSASPLGSGGDIGGALSENDLASYLNDKTAEIPKAYEGRKGGEKGTKLPSPFDPQADTASGDDAPEVNANESEGDNDELDLSLLDSDSEDTNDKEDDDDKSESVFEIQVDGKKFEVKQSELIADAQKWRASTNKFQEASEMRKEADEVKEMYSKERETLKGLLAQYQNFIEASYKEQQPDWQQLLDTNPVEYIRQKEYWQARIDQANQARAYQEQLRKQTEAETKVKQAEHLKAQQSKIFEMFPSWKNPDVAKKAASSIENYLAGEGFSKDEMDGLADARMLAVVHKAAQYDQLVKANNQRKQQKPSGKTLNAGTATTGDPGFAKRQAQTAAAREAKGWNDQLKSNPTQKSLEAYLANQWSKSKK